jgi:hypothetical protein
MPTVAETAATPTPDTTEKKFAPGLLSIKLLETRNLKMPIDCGVTPGGPTGKNVAQLPLAVIEIDKNEVMMRAVEANPETNTVMFQTKANFDIGRPSDCVISLYIPGPDRKDIFLGSVIVRPSFIDQKVDEEWVPLNKPAVGNEAAQVIGEIKGQFVFRIMVNII